MTGDAVITAIQQIIPVYSDYTVAQATEKAVIANLAATADDLAAAAAATLAAREALVEQSVGGARAGTAARPG